MPQTDQSHIEQHNSHHGQTLHPNTDKHVNQYIQSLPNIIPKVKKTMMALCIFITLHTVCHTHVSCTVLNKEPFYSLLNPALKTLSDISTLATKS